MKIIALGDIHGRTCWRDIIKRENPDLTVFLGDYVSTHEGITENDQICNLQDILDFKHKNSSKVILLRGNHDIQHLGYYWAECSGYCHNVFQFMKENEKEFLDSTQWVYIYKDILFSHAGVSEVWLEKSGLNSVEDINKTEPSEIFGFTPNRYSDYYGDSVTQPPTWIRPNSLLMSRVKDYIHIVGHTGLADRQKILIYEHENENPIYFCDTLPNEYLVITENDYGDLKIEQKKV